MLFVLRNQSCGENYIMKNNKMKLASENFIKRYDKNKVNFIL